jgi:hypothetical protein
MDLSRLQDVIYTQFLPTSSATPEQTLATRSGLTQMLVNHVVSPGFQVQLRSPQSPFL